MKLLTLNTHSLMETDFERKRKSFVQAILKEKPDIMALQEVNQSRPAHAVSVPPEGCVAAPSISLRSDNYAYRIAKSLREGGLNYQWVWLPMKIGYDRFDEGIAVFSRTPVKQWQKVRLSDSQSYENFRTRYALGICTGEVWYYSVHTGRWQDGEERFARQWERLSGHLEGKRKVWLMGDFNSPAGEAGTGYDLITKSGWYDSYRRAKRQEDGITVPKEIDGWRDEKRNAMRIDYIWSNYPTEVNCAGSIFNGRREEIVSDHFGVMVETEI